MNSRTKKSALIVIGSVAGDHPLAGALPYSCAKIFAGYFAQGLGIELDGKIDTIVH